MSHQPTLVLAALLAAFAIGPATVAAEDVDNAARLQKLVDVYVDARRPGAPRAQRADFSAESFLAEIEEKRELLNELDAVTREGLTLEQDIDRRLLLGIARSDIKTANTLRVWENDPALYIPSRQLGQLLQDDYVGDPGEREDKLLAVLSTLPDRLNHARKNLKRPPRRFTEAGIFQAGNTLESMDAASSSFSGEELQQAWTTGHKALKDYRDFLQQDLLPKSDASWALGKEAYDYILRERWHMDADADQILKRGRKAFEDTEALAQEVAGRIRPGAHWTEVYETLKDQHPPAEGIKQAYQDQMDAAQVFVLENSILTLPEGERVITLDTPPAMRRSSPFGTFQTASPFDGGLEGRLILTPIEDWMPPEQRAQRLRSHHDAWIPIIAVHEAYPGHHAQALKVNENPNLLRRVIRESIFSEGWGLFTEELMFELGFLKGDEVRLTQLRNRLWRAARVILDSSLHTGRMEFDEAVDFLVEKVRFERYAAELEVGIYIRRPTYVLGYLIGMQDLLEIRAEYIERHGPPDPPSQFYDRLLRIGSIPPALLREELFSGR